ncbi:hypothetical protein ABFS82_14G157500 [Erythranthe guttata]|uniref:BHLH domain-containing protein n=2 Tax=Erythranthe guttata TaxID=4155 RepID=A0A022RQJ5_ERYGU|nr:PREDICTED: transcription factor bHLH91-like isoform X2 [Erythranthe guttata]EYU42281.1 hypothetical protein MIMGU_mgv1a006478mg [Erythranthe guttata]|eukprot:XP_012831430.1 PREDICTED: transcription factor bHLH91-like isoform X2 [Erythranthe guttata]
MYEQSSDFDQTMNLHEQEEGGGLMGQNDVVNYPIISNQEVAAMEMELHHQLNLEIEHCFNNNNGGQQINNSNNDSSNSWQLEQMNAAFNLENQNQDPIFNTAQYPTTTDLLNIFPFPKYPSLLSNSSISFSTHNKNSSNNNFLASLGLLGEINPNVGGDGTSASGSVIYDPLLPLNLPPQPPLLRDLFHSLPNNYTKNGGCSLFGNVDERDNNNNHGNVGLMYQNDNGVFEFTAAGEIDCVGKSRDGKDTKHFATERHRRLLLNDKFQALRKLIPNPSKDDRASIVGDAINYINELKRSVAELKLLVEKKRCSRERMKRPKTENENESNSLGNLESGSSLRSSWLQRKSKNTEVDVRIVDDEVTVKLVQQKRINCLLFVSKVLDELQLDLHHVAGGLIGDYYSFLFNSKICEGSIVYASAVANKLIEVVDKQYAAIPPSSSY